MELSYFLAQLMGLSLVIYGVAGFIRPQMITSAMRSISHESFSMLVFGFVGIVVGLAVVLSHNVWDGTWRTLVTLYGWGAIAKGGLYLVAPQRISRWARMVWGNESRARMVLVVVIALGAYLAYKGFGY